MEELHFTGNALKGSRPILSFDRTFEEAPHWMVIRELLVHVFGVPRGARKSKPFIDHVVSFTVADGKVWFRNYQIAENEPTKSKAAAGDENAATEDANSKSKSKSSKKHGPPALNTDLSLIEIGPRFILTPIVILEGSFGGPVIYENKEFVSPNAVRAEIRTKASQKFNMRATAAVERQIKRKNLKLDTGPERGELDEDVLFG